MGRRRRKSGRGEELEDKGARRARRDGLRRELGKERGRERRERGKCERERESKASFSHEVAANKKGVGGQVFVLRLYTCS